MLQDREANRTIDVIDRQCGARCLALMRRRSSVWLLPTSRYGRSARASRPPEQAQEIHSVIRSLVRELAGPAVADALRILYGGSVKADNVDALMKQPDVDGALVGGASLKADESRASCVLLPEFMFES